MSEIYYKKVSIKDELPNSIGKYPVFTESSYGFGKLKGHNQFSAHFNGKSFEVNNQFVTHWLKELNVSEIDTSDKKSPWVIVDTASSSEIQKR